MTDNVSISKEQKCDPVMQSLGSRGWVGACACGERVIYRKADQWLAQSWWEWHEIERIMQSISAPSTEGKTK